MYSYVFICIQVYSDVNLVENETHHGKMVLTSYKDREAPDQPAHLTTVESVINLPPYGFIVDSTSLDKHVAMQRLICSYTRFTLFVRNKS